MLRPSLKYILFAFAALACVGAVRADTAAQNLIHSYFSAYNAHDVEEMLTMVTDDVRWMSVDDNNIYVEAEGRESLGNGMVSHFRNSPTTRSEVRAISELGQFVTVIEAAMRDADGVTHSQCAISVYQLADGLITNVWYYGAQPCERFAE